ncbi:kinase-like domain-containing protein [Cercophora samala]|uniref:Autophagy-related protein 1 n=1 Tax=Cercophora samala TaxID=330535 RepID=A0AA40D9Z3_9PEZI|nr:kinase-like domain-containing protein [Cercophora samala]
MANHITMSFDAVRDTRLPATVENNVTIHRISKVRQGNPSWRQERWVRHDNNILGHGGRGLVWLEKKEKILEAEEDRCRAVKAIRVADGKSTNEGVRYGRELEALNRFSQPKYADFFVEFFGWYEIPNYLCIAMEYCEYGDLRKYLQVVKTMPEDEVKVVASQVLGALAMMHEAGSTHRDVKPANILIKSKPPERWWVKLCDLGLSKRAEDIAGAFTTVKGTAGFLAPEMLDWDLSTGQRGSFPIDMWCFGETVYQMLTGEPVFKTFTELFHYRAGSIQFPDQAFQRVKASLEVRDFVRSLMLAHPLLRLTATTHPIYGAQGHRWMARSPLNHLPVQPQASVTKETATEWPPPFPPDGSVSPKGGEVFSTRNTTRSKPVEVRKREFKEAITKVASKLVVSSPPSKDSNPDTDELPQERKKATDQDFNSTAKTRTHMTQPGHQQSDLTTEARLPVKKENKSLKKHREERLRIEKLNELRKFAETFKLSTPVPPEVAELFSREKPPKDNPEDRTLTRTHNLLQEEVDESWTVVTSRRKNSAPPKKGRPAHHTPVSQAKASPVRENTPIPRRDVAIPVLPTTQDQFVAYRPAPRLPKASTEGQSWAEVAATEGGEPAGQRAQKKVAFQEEITIR